MRSRSLPAVLGAATAAVLAAGLPAAPAAADPAPRIVGGKAAAEGAYPWVTYLSIQNFYQCGGSLISRDIVLSAAHCFEGGHDRSTASVGRVDHRQGTKRNVVGVKYGKPPPPSGPLPDDVADWAVVKLDQPITDIAPVAVPADGKYDATPSFRTMGWGATSEGGQGTNLLREVDLPYIPDASCPEVVGPAEICAGDLAKGGIDTCQGDSGGPLAARDGDRWVVVGATSWGIGCARAENPGHYAQVSAFIPQLTSAIRELGGTLPAGW
ncbi:trypsin [Pilimelia anulata]|uniref:Trypsin n=1 Tax=Pilimelia anulata TaxID=53371 RepID=A0A8J3F6B0_9ACTN|nr:serine protease [Pilimelia anulata]GGJ79164.1 trypsin [Pilimelia anulata]